jgi:hypothetical protein
MKLYIILNERGEAFDHQSNQWLPITGRIPMFTPLIVVDNGIELLHIIVQDEAILRGGKQIYEVTDDFYIGEKIAEGSTFTA